MLPKKKKERHFDPCMNGKTDFDKKVRVAIIQI